MFISNVIMFIIMIVNIKMFIITATMICSQIGVQVEYKLEMARGFVKKGEEARFILSSSSSSSSSPASSLFKKGRRSG